MITHHPMAQHVKPRRKLLPIGNKREFAARVLGSLGVLAGLLLAVGAIGR